MKTTAATHPIVFLVIAAAGGPLAWSSAAEPVDGAGNSPPAPAESAQIDASQLHFDWGEVLCGEEIRHSFVVHNRGKAILELGPYRGGRGAVWANGEDRWIPPGEKGEVILQLDTIHYLSQIRSGGYRPERIEGCIHLGTNDAKHPSVAFEMSGIVLPSISIEPLVPTLKGRRGKALSATVTLRRQGASPIESLSVKTSGPVPIEARVTEAKPGEEYILTISLKTEKVDPFRTGASAQVSARMAARNFSFSIRPEIEVLDAVYPSRREILIDERRTMAFLKGGEPPVEKITLRGYESRAFSILGVQLKLFDPDSGRTSAVSGDPPLAIRAEIGKRSSEQEVAMELRKAVAESRTKNCFEILIRTDDPEMPEVTIRAKVLFPRGR